MFWLARLIRLLRPMPPTPTPATFSVSLGGVNPRPRTRLGTMAHAAPPAATFVRNARREISFFLLMSILQTCIIARSFSLWEGKFGLRVDQMSTGNRALAYDDARLGPLGQRFMSQDGDSHLWKNN